MHKEYCKECEEELDSIPCKLRQDGVVASIVQDEYSKWQLQSSRTGSGICDNNAWVKISNGDEVFDKVKSLESKIKEYNA